MVGPAAAWRPSSTRGRGTNHLVRRLAALPAVAVVCASLTAGAGAFQGAGTAEAATTAAGFYINGAGFGHGVGMSQYGALGFALHGYSYRSILSHYYRDTSLSRVSPTRVVSVLLKNGAASFRDADRLSGGRVVWEEPGKAGKAGKSGKTPIQKPDTLKPNTTYSVLSSGGLLNLIAHGRKVAAVRPPLDVGGNGPVTLLGVGSYHGQLQFRPAPDGGVQTVNAVDLEDYVRGVIPAEMPSSWPAQALEAQAVAARTFVTAVPAASPEFDVYSDTRSQVYGGVSAQTPTGDTAEAATRGQVVDYAGRPALTYFFSSSGGHTESVQNVFLGVAPEAWLIGVPDPYDDSDGNPYYRWHQNLSVGAAARTLGTLVKGRLEGIKVLQHGVSPRIVQAAVVGTEGTSHVSGPQLRKLFDLRSTYASFMTIKTKSVTLTTPTVSTKSAAPKVGSPKRGRPKTSSAGNPKAGATTRTVTTPNGSSSGGGGLGARARRRAKIHHELQGTTFPAVTGQTILAERLITGAWRRAGLGRLTAEGSYDIPVADRGLYRVVYQGVDGPAVSVK